MRAHALVVAALAVELAAWALGGSNRTETFAWFRVAAHLGAVGLLGAAAAGLAAAALPPRPAGRWGWIALATGALALHLAFLDVPQGQPDTVVYFTAAQHVARDPIGTLLDWGGVVWGTEEARFHQPFPLVPALLGLAYRVAGETPATTDWTLTAWAVALPLVVAWAGAREGRPAFLAGAVVATLPLLQAQSGWLLVDLPLCTLVTLGWGAMLRARDPRGAALALLACLPALATKVSAALFLAGPAVALLYRSSPGFVAGLGVVALLALGVVDPPRLREPGVLFPGLVAILLHCRPALWLAALPRLRGDDAVGRVLLGALGALPVVWLWSPAEHAARYALPLVPVLAWAASAVAPRLAAFVAASGLVLLLGGYRPLVIHHQAVNLRDATRALDAEGVRGIEVWGDLPGTTFPTGALAALVDYYAVAPVTIGGTLRQAPPEGKRRWWEFHAPPAWRVAPIEADGALLLLFGADARAFEAAHPEWRRAGETSLYRASSQLHPKEVVRYRK